MLKLNSIAKDFAKTAKERLGNRIISIILYGSVAKNKARKESDIDIFAVVSDSKAKDELFDIASEYLKKGILLSIIVETPETLSQLKKKSPFVNDVIKEGKILYGTR